MKGKLLKLTSAVSFGLLLSHSVLGAQAVVMEIKPSCDYFVTKVDATYAVLELNGGSEPRKGDQLVGNFGDGYMGHLENARTGDKIKVWFESYPVSREEALRLYNGYAKSSCKQ